MENNEGVAKMAYNFDKEILAGDWLIHVDTEKQYGSFENQETGTGGGLWFENNELTDYDGVWELPSKVIKALVVLGFNVDYVTEE
jgi:hypothetical protein